METASRYEFNRQNPSSTVRWRRRSVPAALLVGAAILVSSLLVTSPGADASPSCGVTSKLVPTCGVLWGAHSSSGWASLEAMVGRKLAIVHDYTGWLSIFPSASEKTAVAGGRILYVDWTARNFQTGRPAATWAKVASGALDGHIKAEAAALKAFRRPIMISFQGEPEGKAQKTYGNAADYVAAWRHIHKVFAAVGVHNVVWVWDVTGDVSDYGSVYHKWYPGDTFVNWIMWDPYNWYGCNNANTHTWKSFSDIVSPMYKWLKANSGKPGNGDYLSKPWGLAEFGTVEGATPTAKAKWFEDAVKAAQTQFPRLKALVYFDSFDRTNGRVCDWTVNTSSKSLTGYRAAGRVTYARTM